MNNTTISSAILNNLSQSFELGFDEYGYIRTLSAKNSSQKYLLELPLNKLPLNKFQVTNLAERFLQLPEIKSILQTENFIMQLSEIASFDFGYRLTFEQLAFCNKAATPIHGGAIHIAINTKGQVFSMASTLQHGLLLPLAKKPISKSKAVSIALNNCKQAIACSQAKFVLFSYKEQIEPLYEVTLTGKLPYQTYTYLILANTGKIIDEHSKKLCYFADNATNSIEANALLLTPDPNIPISRQVSKITINDLPNRLVLKNQYFEMFTGPFAKTVRAKDDNTYCYGTRDHQFAAVSVFLSLQKQLELYLELGLRKPQQPMFVVVNDPMMLDNAFFDPLGYQIHIGVGSGVKHRGLAKNIAFDLGVSNHEFGHAVVFLQVPGGDLASKQGEAINEALGDVLGAFTMDCLNKIWQAQLNGKPFTAEDIKNDPRIIGKYALPPFGIRCQKNNKKMPNDWVGEPHADGLIVGGALADLLIALSAKGPSLENQIKTFVKLTLMALALMPSYKVTFTDLLRALFTADNELYNGKHRSLIEACFEAHGITTNTTARININNLAKTLLNAS